MRNLIACILTLCVLLPGAASATKELPVFKEFRSAAPERVSACAALANDLRDYATIGTYCQTDAECSPPITACGVCNASVNVSYAQPLQRAADAYQTLCGVCEQKCSQSAKAACVNNACSAGAP